MGGVGGGGLATRDTEPYIYILYDIVTVYRFFMGFFFPDADFLDQEFCEAKIS